MLGLFKNLIRFGYVVVFVMAFALFGRHACAQSAKGCRNVEGRLSASVTSDEPLQMSGPVSGSLAGNYDFQVETITHLASDVSLMTATSVIHTRKGDLNISEAGAIDSVTGNFSFLWTVTGGTGMYEHATGQMIATGTSNAGTAATRFSGEVCTP